MDLRRTQLLATLIFWQQLTWGAGDHLTVREGAEVVIKCQPPESNRPSTIWFRVLDSIGMEFIGSFDINGNPKTTDTRPTSEFDFSKISSDTLTLRDFRREKDSGQYSCATYKAPKLIFGKVTRLVGERTSAPKTTKATETKIETECTTAAECVCEKRGEGGSQLDCSLLILGPLAGSCGLLLLLLLVTSLYCNKIRTRRCPHHHKRKPRTMPVGPK